MEQAPAHTNARYATNMIRNDNCSMGNGAQQENQIKFPFGNIDSIW